MCIGVCRSHAVVKCSYYATSMMLTSVPTDMFRMMCRLRTQAYAHSNSATVASYVSACMSAKYIHG